MAAWRPLATPDLSDGLILYDGVCVLCSTWVRFVFARDAAARFRFVPIQSAFGRALAARLGIDADAPQTNAVIADGRALFRSDAALAVLGALPGWRAILFARRCPRPLRDWLYERVARNRYRLFGRTDQCMVPSGALRARVLTEPPGAA